ncbi:hypothetical protein [Verminephrobacter eiseniae]|uniref:hypothetical protein n=1 Tax=Verminephrobacter eiseniae TaxID=364317 RepID=UPI002238155F|nr:hypothetical protein [Verminephrobacter eiseniae]
MEQKKKSNWLGWTILAIICIIIWTAIIAVSVKFWPWSLVWIIPLVLLEVYTSQQTRKKRIEQERSDRESVISMYDYEMYGQDVKHEIVHMIYYGGLSDWHRDRNKELATEYLNEYLPDSRKDWTRYYYVFPEYAKPDSDQHAGMLTARTLDRAKSEVQGVWDEPMSRDVVIKIGTAIDERCRLDENHIVAIRKDGFWSER